MGILVIMAVIGVAVGVSIGWLLIAGSVPEIFREW